MPKSLAKERLGLTTTTNDGEVITIVEYRDNCHMVVEFEDGTRMNAQYSSFLKRDIRKPGKYINQYIGKTFELKSGHTFTITEYRNNKDVDGYFEDGTVQTHVCVGALKKGSLLHPNDELPNRIGLVRCMNNGMQATIIAYRKYKDIDVQLETGEILQHCDYKAWEEGRLPPPKHGSATKQKRLNEQRAGQQKCQNGTHIATILEYRTYYDIDVQFEDGCVAKNVSYGSFSKGKLLHPNQTTQDIHKQNLRAKYVGLHNINDNDMTMQIIKYEGYKNVLVQFEDTYTIWTTLKHFQDGTVQHPNRVTSKKPHCQSSCPSMPEFCMLYYLRPLGFEKYPRGYFRKFHEDFGTLELDLFHEPLKEAYEYDGYWHYKESVVQNDLKKEQICAATNIRLTKVREATLPMGNHPNAIIRYNPNNDDELSQIIQTIIQSFCMRHNITYDIDVDIARDKPDIIHQRYQEWMRLKKRHIGETAMSNCGLLMTIIDYQGPKQVTVQFETGEIRENRHYTSFKNGEIAPEPGQYPSYNRRHAEERLGQTKMMCCGQSCNIIAYHSSKNIDVQFEDGAIAYNKRYSSFLDGSIEHPNIPHTQYYPIKSKVGRQKLSKWGELMTVTKEFDAHAIEVVFENGETVQTTYKQFMGKGVRSPYLRTTGCPIAAISPTNTTQNAIIAQERVGQVFFNAQGERVTILQYHAYMDITVQFDDGTIREHVKYHNLQRGYVPKPKSTI